MTPKHSRVASSRKAQSEAERDRSFKMLFHFTNVAESSFP